MLAQRSLTPDDRVYAAENVWERTRRACEGARSRRNALLPQYNADRLSELEHPLTFDSQPDGLSPSDLSRS